MTTSELRIGQYVKTTLSKDRGKPQKIIALSEYAVSFSMIGYQYLWVPIELIKRCPQPTE